MAEILNVPPNNLEAEQAVLGSIMLENQILDDLSSMLFVEDFYNTKNQKVYSAILDLYKNSEPIDLITLNNIMKVKGTLESAGDTTYLTYLTQSTPTAANHKHYLKIVKEMANLRALIAMGRNTVSRCHEGESSQDIAAYSEKTLFNMQVNRKTTVTPVSNMLAGTFKEIEAVYKKDISMEGIPTGYEKLDALTAGLHGSELIIIAGRPSMGKTALALNLMANISLNYGMAGLIFSLEMSKEALTKRLICAESGVSGHKMRSGYLASDDFPKLIKACQELGQVEILINDDADIAVEEIRTIARRAKLTNDIRYIVVDYLQLIRKSRHSSAGNREQEISEISRSLKALAKELKVPVIALSQLNRSCEMRTNKRPMLSDIRESGAIEQDADIIAFVYRDIVYNENTDDKNVAEIIIGKQRNGPIGTVRLAFKKDCMKFENLAEEHSYDSGTDRKAYKDD